VPIGNTTVQPGHATTSILWPPAWYGHF
jgi:hypothetical protein